MFSGMLCLGAMGAHLRRVYGLRHGMRLGRDHAEAGHDDLHGKQARYQAGKSTGMSFLQSHARQINARKMKVQ